MVAKIGTYHISGIPQFLLNQSLSSLGKWSKRRANFMTKVLEGLSKFTKIKGHDRWTDRIAAGGAKKQECVRMFHSKRQLINLDQT